jgi:2-methylcitrate dehydratase PrpD
MLRALAIAASTAAGLRANFGTMTKSLHAGQAAEWGVRAAQLAARGITASADIFDRSPGGFLDAYGANATPMPQPGDLEILASGIGIKPYACCGAGVSVIDAALDLGASHAFDAADIVSVDVTVSEMAAAIMPFHGAADGNQAKYSLAYCAAVALLDRAGGLAQFDDARVAREDVRDLASRTTVRAKPGLAAGQGRFGVELSARLRDGRCLAASVEVPRGHPHRRLDDAQLADKFCECAGPVLGEYQARSAAVVLETLFEASDVRPLISLLRKE